MTRILIADDHAIVRDGLRRIIEAQAGLVVAAEAVDGDDVVRKVHAGGFDVLLLDMSMPGKSGLDLIRHVKSVAPRLPILVLSMHAEEQYAVRTMRAGASGYLTKDSAASQLVGALQKVASGGMYVSAAVAELLARGLNAGGSEDTTPHKTLSNREHEVFLALVSGESVSDIAARMNLSVKTVSTHKSRVLEKMKMDGIADLVRYAVAHRLIDTPDLPR